jgi:nicotinamidase-related amidase
MLTLTLRRQEPVLDDEGFRGWRPVESRASLVEARTAVVICDVWDRHWCRGAVERLERMLGRMSQLVAAARDGGALIVHAPSDTMAAYAGSPARARALSAPVVEPPQDLSHPDPPLPVDSSDGGCDTEGNAAGPDRRVWTRQHPRLAIDEARDAISDNGREIYSLLRSRDIAHVLLLGVHTNMCILNRTFAIKQMVRWGVDIALCRDLTDAMYNPALRPYVSHEEGTRLVVEYIEKFWCPTFESADVLGREAAGPQRGTGLVDVLGR